MTDEQKIVAARLLDQLVNKWSEIVDLKIVIALREAQLTRMEAQARQAELDLNNLIQGKA